MATLEELLRLSDIVSLQQRVSKVTTDMINRDRLKSMRPDALLVISVHGALLHYVAPD